jgi:hypothetical protein
MQKHIYKYICRRPIFCPFLLFLTNCPKVNITQ